MPDLDTETEVSKSIVELLADLDDGESATKDKELVEFIGESGKTWKSKEERIRQSFDLKMRGVPISAIAITLGISVGTVHNDLRQHAEDYRKRLEQEPAANLIADALVWYDDIERACLFEASQAGKGSVIPSKTGEIIRSGADNKEKLPFIQTAMKARESKIKLMMDTGIIPKEPEKIYHSLKDDKSRVEEKTGLTRSEEELKASIVDLLSRARRL